MKFANAIKPDRKSVVAKWRDLQFLLVSAPMRVNFPRERGTRQKPLVDSAAVRYIATGVRGAPAHDPARCTIV
jgi:hypothetical protein